LSSIETGAAACAASTPAASDIAAMEATRLSIIPVGTNKDRGTEVDIAFHTAVASSTHDCYRFARFFDDMLN